MKKGIYTDLDLKQHFLINARIEQVSSLPTEGNFVGRLVHYLGSEENGPGIYICVDGSGLFLKQVNWDDLGSIEFTELGGVPDSYIGHRNKVVVVSQAEDGLEFSDILKDESGINAIWWDDRVLYDSHGLPSVRWGDRDVYSSDGLISLDWDSRILKDSTDNIYLNWGTGQISTNLGIGIGRSYSATADDVILQLGQNVADNPFIVDVHDFEAMTLFRSLRRNDGVVSLFFKDDGSDAGLFYRDVSELEPRFILSYSKGLEITNGTEKKVKIYVDGDVEVYDYSKGIILHSPNGKRWRYTAGDDGVLNFEEIL